jgi:nucleotide-binding universal stress UspA family protein
VVEFTRILCPVDLSEPSMRALAHAAAIARWYDATLTVLHVVPTFEPRQVRAGALGDAVQFVQPLSREEVLRELRRAVKAAGIEVPRVTMAAEEGDAAATIIDRTVALASDLVVLGTRGRSGVDRLLLGSVAEKVLRKAPCAVLTVPPHAPDTPAPPVAFQSILCPVDFSPSSLLALGFALDLARQAGGRLTLLHSIEWLAEDDIARSDVLALRDQLRERAAARLREAVQEESRTWCEITEAVTMGRAHREILRQAATTRADLIVMGAQGRGGAGLLLFGSTTEQVVRAAGCPVLTARAPRVDAERAEPGIHPA